MFVEQLLPTAREHLVTISIDAPLIEAAKCLHGKKVSLVVVCNLAGVMAWVVTKTDVVRQISGCQGNSCTTDAAAVMTSDVAFCHPDIVLRDVWITMKERGLKHIPVVDQNLRPIGVLNARQAAQALLEEVENEEELLREYVQGIGYR